MGKPYKSAKGFLISNSTSEIEKPIASKTNDESPKKTFMELDSDAMDIDITKCKSNSDNSKEIENGKDSADKVDQIVEGSQDIKLVYTETNDSDNTPKNVKRTPPKSELPAVLSARTPRRVKLITISSPKRSKNT